MSLWDFYVFSVETARYIRHSFKDFAHRSPLGVIGRLLGIRGETHDDGDTLTEQRRAA